MLVAATVMWGCGFTWAKAGGDAINRFTGQGQGALIGPVLLLAVRFVGAAILWVALVPSTRRGWTWDATWRGAVVGLILSLAIVLQHIGLDRTTEAVSAFLTSLTIVFVPLIQAVFKRRLPSPVLATGVVVAAVGVYLLLGARFDQFGWGEALGLACAVGWSVYILAVDAWGRQQETWRFTSIQFIVCGLVMTLFCLTLPGGAAALGNLDELLLQPDIFWNTLLMTLLATAIAFALLNRYQPMLDPTRASLLYMVEPIVASIFAWVMIGRGQTVIAMIGAGLILLANVLVEVLGRRGESSGREESLRNADFGMRNER